MSPLVTIIIALMVSSVTSFNLDSGQAVVYSGQPGSLFGFSVAAHRDQKTGW